MRIAILTVQVPFVRGGAEILSEGLITALYKANIEAEIVSIPFKWYPPERILDQMLACRLLDVSESNGSPIDMVIGLKFPAYLIPHPNKVMWLIHQHRTAYELWGTGYCDLMHSPNGTQVRDAIINADNKAFGEYKAIYTIAQNVSKRLKLFNQIDSTPLYNPPRNAELFYTEEAEDYFFFPSRLTTIKRQELVLEALALTKKPVKVMFAGRADGATYESALRNLTRKLRLGQRVTFLGEISEEDKIKYYAKALGVVYPPFDEDYGYVTLEAMLSSKPIITCTDSGGSLEFTLDKQTGIISEPTPKDLASAMDAVWEDRSWARTAGLRAREYYDSLDITWSNVVKKLLG